MRPILSLTSNIAALAGVALLAAAATAAYVGLRSVHETLRTERLSLQVFAYFEGLQGNLREAESLQREFLLTGDPSLVARYETQAARIRATMLELEKRVENPTQRKALPALTVAILERVDAIAQSLQERRSLGAAEAVRRAFQPDRTAVARRAEQLLDEALRRQQGIVAQRQSAAADDVGFLERAVLVGVLFAAVLLGWSLRMGQRQEAARQAAEAALQARSRELRLLIDAVPAMIAYVDTTQRILLHNRAISRFLGIPSARIDGSTLREVLGDDVHAKADPYVARALAGEEVRYERRQPRADGEIRDVSVALVPHKGAAGSVLGYYALLTDVTELKQLSRAKSEFVSVVSHELRTPVTVIRGSLELLRAGSTGNLPAAAAQLVEIADAACGRLLRLLDDLLDIERIEAGELALDLSEQDLSQLLAPTLAELAPLAAQRSVRLELAAAPQAARVRTDANRFGQVLSNLLSNAIQFSPAEAVVSVALERSGGGFRVSVSDRGPGVSETFRPRLFEKFSQDPGVARGRTGRFGLGLAISKMLVERLGGSIGHEPREGGGSVFWFELPAAG